MTDHCYEECDENHTCVREFKRGTSKNVMNEMSYVCMPIYCGAEDACPEEQECVRQYNECNGSKPCKQYYCHNVKGDTLTPYQE